MQLFFNAEASVPKPSVVMPRIPINGHQALAVVYCLHWFAFLCCGLAGIEPFDALNYAFLLLLQVDLHRHQQGLYL